MTAPLHLYDFTNDYLAIIDQISEAGGEISETLANALAAVEDSFEVKAEKLVLFVRNLEALALAAVEESRRLEMLALSRRNTAEGLKRYLFSNMKLLGKEHITRPLAKIAIVNNGGSLPVEWNGTPEEIPAPYRVEKLVYSLDRAKVLEDHAAKVTLPVGLTVKPRGERLSIR